MKKVNIKNLNADDIKDYIFNKIGLEIEFNWLERLGNYRNYETEYNEYDEEITTYFFDISLPEKYDILSKYTSTENRVLYEAKTKAIKFYQTNRLNIGLLHLTNLFHPDFYYRHGKDDKRAESNHLHISLSYEDRYDHKVIGYLAQLFIPFFSRNFYTFRDSIDLIDNYGWVHMDIETSPYDIKQEDKEFGIIYHWDKHIELRLNENIYCMPLIYLLQYVYVKYKLGDVKIFDKLIKKLKHIQNNCYDYNGNLDYFYNEYYKKVFLPLYNYLFRNNEIFVFYKRLYKWGLVSAYYPIWEILNFIKDNVKECLKIYENFNKKIFKHMFNFYNKKYKFEFKNREISFILY